MSRRPVDHDLGSNQSAHASHTASSSRSPTSAGSGDGFLGAISKWQDIDPDNARGQYGGYGSPTGSPSTIRTGPMIGNTFGVSNPPPQGPPPTSPPPLPPTNHLVGSSAGSPSHPFASGSIPKRTSSSLGQTAWQASRSHMSIPARTVSPPLPPPTAELPALPSSVTGHGRTTSISSKSSKASRRLTQSPPRVSPRTTSLASPSQNQMQYQRHLISESSYQSPQGGSITVRPKAPRTPSRHLLQTALDLAQKAVEMDKSNDVMGALVAYREAVDRLKHVMERVNEPLKDDPKRRRSTGRTEEEGRTLKGIHDAYVARIELLSSFEEDDQQAMYGSQDGPTHGPAHKQSASVSSSIHTRYDVSSTEGTPRPTSLEDSATGIGNLMLNDVGDMSMDATMHSGPSRTSSPGDSTLGSPFSTGRTSARTLGTQGYGNMNSLKGGNMHTMGDPDSASINGSPAQHPPRRTSIGATSTPSDYLGSPVSTFSSEQSHHTANAGNVRRRLLSRSAKGLETELGIAEDEEEGMEVLSRTPQRTGAPLHPDSQAHPLAQAQLSPRRESSPYGDNGQRPLPPLPNSAPLVDQAGRVLAHQRQASTTSDRSHTGSILVSPTVKQGTINQRRTSRGLDGTPLTGSADVSMDDMPAQLFNDNQPHSAPPSIHPPRSRTRSQPGNSRFSDDDVPPMPAPLHHRTSYSSMKTGRVSSLSSVSGHGHDSLRVRTDSPANLGPPLASSAHSSIRSHNALTRTPSGNLISPIPEPQPPEIIHRSFHLLRLICISMDATSSGAYLTAHIHISPAVWQPSQWARSSSKTLGPPRITAQDVKYRVLETMSFHLDNIARVAGPMLDGEKMHRSSGNRPADVNRPMAISMAEDLIRNLDAMDEDMDTSWRTLNKAGVQVQPWKEKTHKRTGNGLSWGSKLKDKMTNGKTLEAPDKYVDLLSHFSFVAQTLNEHLLNFTGPCTASYAALPDDVFRKCESRVSNAAQFFSSAIVPFILEDTMQFVARYMKGGVRYLEE